MGSGGGQRPAVAPDSPAAAAGIRKGDVILAIDGRPVDARHPLDNVLVGSEANTEVTLTLVRDGKERQVKVQLGERDGRPVGC